MNISSDLTHLERKLLTILQHHNRRGKLTTLPELEMRLGHSETEIQDLINSLIERNWIVADKGQWIVTRILF